MRRRYGTYGWSVDDILYVVCWTVCLLKVHWIPQKFNTVHFSHTDSYTWKGAPSPLSSLDLQFNALRLLFLWRKQSCLKFIETKENEKEKPIQNIIQMAKVSDLGQRRVSCILNKARKTITTTTTTERIEINILNKYFYTDPFNIFLFGVYSRLFMCVFLCMQCVCVWFGPLSSYFILRKWIWRGKCLWSFNICTYKQVNTHTCLQPQAITYIYTQRSYSIIRTYHMCAILSYLSTIPNTLSFSSIWIFNCIGPIQGFFLQVFLKIVSYLKMQQVI